jgi:hypothetical protein
MTVIGTDHALCQIRGLSGGDPFGWIKVVSHCQRSMLLFWSLCLDRLPLLPTRTSLFHQIERAFYCLFQVSVI